METHGDQSGSDERRKRQEALRALAEGASVAPGWEVSAPSAPKATPLRRAPRRWPRWALPLMSAVALLAVVAVVVAHGSPATRPAATRHIPAKLTLDPLTYGVACLQGAAWSPDSRHIAILGAQESCSVPLPEFYTYYPTIVAIVDVASGKLVGQLAPDATVQRDLHLHAPQYITPENGLAGSGDLTQQGAQYYSISWAPDGKSIALLFSITYATKPFTGSPGPGGAVNLSGLYLGAVNGSSAHAYAVKPADGPRFTGEWNVKTGRPMLAATALDTSGASFSSPPLLPASLNYAWKPDGSLVGSRPLSPANPPARAPLAPVGAPDGGASFTIWQPMSVQANASNGVKQETVAAFVAAMSLMAWSPDGTYLLTAYAAWRLLPSQQPVPNASQLAVEGAKGMPILPIRDAAMDAMLRPVGGQPDTYTADAFAWSPDGKRLAAHLNTVIEGGDKFAILDCATGKTLATITVNSASNANGNIQSGPGMMWSPDGLRLLVGSGAELFVLGPGALSQK